MELGKLYDGVGGLLCEEVRISFGCSSLGNSQWALAHSSKLLEVEMEASQCLPTLRFQSQCESVEIACNSVLGRSESPY